MLRWLTMATLLYCTMALSRVPLPKEAGDSIFKVRGPNQVADIDLNPINLSRLPEPEPQREPSSLKIRLANDWFLTTQPQKAAPFVSFGASERCAARVGYFYCR